MKHLLVPMKQLQLTEDEFFEKYKPVANHLAEDAGWGGVMFETYGEELDYVLSIANSEDSRRVWTIVDGDNGQTVIGDGYHLVNRIGYIITEKPCEDDTMVEAYDKEDWPDFTCECGADYYVMGEEDINEAKCDDCGKVGAMMPFDED